MSQLGIAHAPPPPFFAQCRYESAVSDNVRRAASCLHVTKDVQSGLRLVGLHIKGVAQQA
jgi:hypothetical protein